MRTDPDGALEKDDGPGLYIHVPFCRAKCPYCDFYSLAAPQLIPRMLEALDAEAALRAPDWPGPLATLFIGGGSPGSLSENQLERLFRTIRGHFRFLPDAEATIELNPEDVTPEKTGLLIEAGINRFSVGVQSFDDQELERIGRRHSARDAARAVEMLKKAGARNIGLDLMYGLPGQTIGNWRRTLENALTFDPEHLSCYQLTLEKGTRLFQLTERGELELPGEEESRNFFLATHEFLTGRGFEHYEISNFARGEAFRCRHNLGYWRRRPYLGLGPSAHSFDGRKRWWNPRSIRDWTGAVTNGRPGESGSEIIGEREAWLEKIMLGLRTSDGIGIKESQAGPETAAVVDGWLRGGLADVRRGRIVLTAKGLALADRLAVQLAEWLE